MILKLQKPIAGDMTLVLVYSQDHKILQTIPYTKELKRWFGASDKKFVEGTLEGSVLTIDREVPDQDW